MSTQEEIKDAMERVKRMYSGESISTVYADFTANDQMIEFQCDERAVSKTFIAMHDDTPIMPELIAEVGLDGDSVFGSDNIRFDYFPPNKELHLVQDGDIVSISLKKKSRSQLLALLKGLGK